VKLICRRSFELKYILLNNLWREKRAIPRLRVVPWIFFLETLADVLYPTAELKAYIQESGGLSHYPVSRPLYAFGLDACFYRDKL